MAADAYGVPDDFFDPIPDEFYRLVGCVVLVATLLEQKVLEPVWSLDQVHTQHHHAGKAGAVLIKEARTALVRLPSLEAEGNDLLDRTDEALNHGHEIVHSLWPDASTDRAWGWRPVTARKRHGPDWIVGVDHDSVPLPAFVPTLVRARRRA